MVKVKVISENHGDRVLAKKINSWLKERFGKITVLGMTLSQGTPYDKVLIWYQEA